MIHERPSALVSAKAAAQMRAMDTVHNSNFPDILVTRACLRAQADAVRECARIAEERGNDVSAQAYWTLAADLDTAAKELE